MVFVIVGGGWRGVGGRLGPGASAFFGQCGRRREWGIASMCEERAGTILGLTATMLFPVEHVSAVVEGPVATYIGSSSGCQPPSWMLQYIHVHVSSFGSMGV